jgi:hypothetical protein
MDLCTPAFLYFIISILSILGSIFMGGSAMTIVISFVFVILFSYFLNWLCSEGYNMVAWVIVLLPLLFSLFLLLMMVSVHTKNIQSPSSAPSSS